MSNLINKIKDKLLYKNLNKIKGLKFNATVNFRLMPIVNIHPKASITIGEHSMINSDQTSYHLSLYGPCKLMADKEGAKITIGAKTRVHGSCIHAFESITIGDNCLIAGNSQIFDCNAHNLSMDNPSNRINTNGKAKPVTIEDNVWIGANVFVLPGVTIGAGSVISANSVVNKDIPSGVLAGGNPAVVIKDFNS